MSDSLHVIAEAGTNHGGNLQTARRLVDIAVAARADSVKFQIIYPEGLYLPRLYVDGTYENNEVFEMRCTGMLDDDAYRELASYCRSQEIPMAASVFDERGLKLLDELAPPYIKIASCDLNHSRLLHAAAGLGRKMIVSTGMASLGEIEQAVNDIVATGHEDLVLMHCVSVYPCPLQKVNLAFIRTLQKELAFPVGLSDHTESSLAGAIAVGMGVTWIEKHFTYDRNAEGFDHAYAMEPDDLSIYIRDMRDASEATRPGEEKVGSAEATTKGRARRGLYAARDIESGHLLAEEDVLIVRPEGPMRPNEIGRVIGGKALRKLHQYEPLSMDLIEPVDK